MRNRVSIMNASSLFITLLLVFSFEGNAQKWKLQTYNLGYRFFEMNAVGNNPTTVAPLLKDPQAYLDYVNTININSLYGFPAIFKLRTFYINGEWKRENPALGFWKKVTVQGGLLLTSRVRLEAGGIGDEGAIDTIRFRNFYSLVRNQQFLGANLGLNRRWQFSSRFRFLTGLHIQGSFSIVHHYEQRWDSTTNTPSRPWYTKTYHLGNREGKTLFQWQLILPIGLEFDFVKDRFGIRAEANLGIVGGPNRPKGLAYSEAHGFGLWLIYKPKQ